MNPDTKTISNYVEIKQFSKVDIEQNNFSIVTGILLIKFLVYDFFNIMKPMFYLLSTHINSETCLIKYLN